MGPVTEFFLTVTICIAAVGSGVIGGVLFAFSGFIMTALSHLPSGAAIAGMRSINRTILRSFFIPLFFLTLICSIALIIIAVLRWDGGRSITMLAGGVLYAVGVVLVTIFFNVPLNDGLASSVGGVPERKWKNYVTAWQRWNHIRTASAIAACFLFIGTIVNT